MLKKSIFLPLCFPKNFDQFCFSVWRVLTFKTAAAGRFQSKKRALSKKNAYKYLYSFFDNAHHRKSTPGVSF